MFKDLIVVSKMLKNNTLLILLIARIFKMMPTEHKTMRIKKTPNRKLFGISE